jgi:hypothetical protein
MGNPTQPSSAVPWFSPSVRVRHTKPDTAHCRPLARFLLACWPDESELTGAD